MTKGCNRAIGFNNIVVKLRLNGSRRQWTENVIRRARSQINRIVIEIVVSISIRIMENLIV
ncbi:hypothetical protein D3C84_939850 [compost metagenome]